MTIDAGKGNDYILNVGTNDVSIAGGAGNDEIYNTEAACNVTINGGDGDDYIFNDGEDISINGGKGNDFISNIGENVTINGGKGNDLLWGSDDADTFLYADGDGKDTVYGFDNADMLQISGKFTATYDSLTDEIYFKVGSTAKAITLKDFTATTFNVNGSDYTISGSKLK